MERPPRRYPRKIVRVDISHFRLKSYAILERGGVDRIIIRRCGRDELTILHPAYFALLKRRAGEMAHVCAQHRRRSAPKRPSFQKVRVKSYSVA